VCRPLSLFYLFSVFSNRRARVCVCVCVRAAEIDALLAESDYAPASGVSRRGAKRKGDESTASVGASAQRHANGLPSDARPASKQVKRARVDGEEGEEEEEATSNGKNDGKNEDEEGDGTGQRQGEKAGTGNVRQEENGTEKEEEEKEEEDEEEEEEKEEEKDAEDETKQKNVRKRPKAQKATKKSKKKDGKEAKGDPDSSSSDKFILLGTGLDAQKTVCPLPLLAALVLAFSGSCD
jgi:hypothetical protein